MIVLFLDDCNGHEGHNPYAALVNVENTNELQMKSLERQQLGVGRRGGRWKEIMEDGNILFNKIKEGRESDFKKEDYDLKYKLISGNY